MEFLLNETTTIQKRLKGPLKIENWTLAAGIVIPLIALIVICIIGILVYRRKTFQYGYGYQQVNHSLDDEEIEFKRFIEKKTPTGSTSGGELGRGTGRVAEVSDSEEGDDDDDVAFDARDMNRLSMLEKYRENLVSGVEAEMKSDNLRL